MCLNVNIKCVNSKVFPRRLHVVVQQTCWLDLRDDIIRLGLIRGGNGQVLLEICHGGGPQTSTCTCTSITIAVVHNGSYNLPQLLAA